MVYNKDLIGQVFGQLTVIGYAEKAENGRTRLKCQCSCGTIKDIDKYNLTHGHIKSCGCLSKQRKRKYNLVGQTFGQLTVIGESSTVNNKTYWKCKCTCGTIKDISQAGLLKGKVKSCGCLLRQRKYNLVGQTFGQLTVIEPAPSKDRRKDRCTYWRCRCTCGTIKDIKQDDLLYGRIKSCGCLNRKPKYDLVGQTFGRLTVLEPAPPRGKYKYWRCRCTCGTIKDIAQNSLVYGDTKSCGCLHRESKYDLVGQTFGRLTVLEPAPPKGNYKYWRCRCTCGTIKDIAQNSLVYGDTKSCGCLHRSKKE